MADKTFGTVVMGVVVDVFKQDPAVVDKSLPQYHLARRAVIDAMEEIRAKRFRYNQLAGSFSTTSSTSYPIAQSLGRLVVTIDRVFYENSNGTLLPKEGILPTSIGEVTRQRSTLGDGATGDYIDCVAVASPTASQTGQNLDLDYLHVSPAPDGSGFKIHVFGLFEPLRLSYDIKDNGEWKYSRIEPPQGGIAALGGGDTPLRPVQWPAPTTITDIDATQSVVFTHAGKLLRFLANANLYAGPLDDEKGRRQEKWRALYSKELERLEIEKENMDNYGEVEPFL